jgi:hypothetical protein
MGNGAIKTYTTEDEFVKLFNDIFSKFHSFLKVKNSLKHITFINYLNGNAVFEIEDEEKMPEYNHIILRDDSENTIYAFLKFIEKKDSITYSFSPIKIQIAYNPRKEERKILDPVNIPAHRLFTINMISEFTIKSGLELYKKNVVSIENTIKLKLEKSFKKIKIYFIHHGKDSRMNYFKSSISPIFIPNINSEPDNKSKEILKYYKETIYANDNELKSNSELISEIAVPIVYNMKIPYGYVQVNNAEPFTESIMQTVKKMAVIINELLNKHGIFQKAEEKITVSDVSKTGIGIIFKDKQCIKYFAQDQQVYFDLLLPDNKKINILADVKHISIKGSIYKVGCKILEIDALSEVYYDEYLESIGLKA